MDANGLWTFAYKMGNQVFSMVATIDNDKITGGNNCYYYSGNVKLENGTLIGNMTGHHFFGNPDPAVGGLKTIPVHFQAKVDSGKMIGTANIQGIPVELAFQGEKRN